MKKDIKIEILREKNRDRLKEMISINGKYETFSYFAPFYDRRTYFKINGDGDIVSKNFNPILILFALVSDVEKLTSFILKYSYPEEKQNLKKIERASNLSIEKSRENLMKTLYSQNLNFSKIFAKELYLRSEKDFFEVLYTFSLMGNPKNMKIFFVYALEKIFKEYKYDENILYLVISYLTKYKDEYSTYLSSGNDKLNKLIEIEKLTEDKRLYFKIFEEVISKYNFKNKIKFQNTLIKYFEQNFILDSDIKEALMEK